MEAESRGATIERQFHVQNALWHRGEQDRAGPLSDRVRHLGRRAGGLVLHHRHHRQRSRSELALRRLVGNRSDLQIPIRIPAVRFRSRGSGRDTDGYGDYQVASRGHLVVVFAGAPPAGGDESSDPSSDPRRPPAFSTPWQRYAGRFGPIEYPKLPDRRPNPRKYPTLHRHAGLRDMNKPENAKARQGLHLIKKISPSREASGLIMM
ncbi:hypothetical protein ADIAG_02465 [Paeniglutamicibacter gangotriensis Lz1y]|uniref:Uncharacterized protein n=1 Tax=Paeniglutamicibacter gangotriensis Lz1y TaxID=1276920 RepID=M7N9I0_9MICC|nr:hypothetical protein ADIAG_02465 [Paeniglutamicibacter gangotriensis Lz1y]